MADNVMFNVKENFNMEAFAARLADTYRGKGYTVNVMNMNGIYSLTFDKGTGGANTLLGLGEGIKANITWMNGAVNINFTDAEWTSKIIGIGVGWFLCLVPFVTAIIGTTRQLSLPKSIGNDAMMIAATM